MADMPAEAKQRTVKGAEAFVRYYIETYNNLAMNPRKGVLSKLGLPECDACLNLDDEIAALVEDGERYASAPAKIKLIAGASGKPTDAVYGINAAIEVSRVDIVDRGGRVVQTQDGDSGIESHSLAWTDQGWRIKSTEVIDR